MYAALQTSTISFAKSTDFNLNVTSLPDQLTVASEDTQMRDTDKLPVCQLLWNKIVTPMSFLGSFALAPNYLHDTRLVSNTFRTRRGVSAISARYRGFRDGMSPTRDTRVLPNSREWDKHQKKLVILDENKFISIRFFRHDGIWSLTKQYPSWRYNFTTIKKSIFLFCFLQPLLFSFGMKLGSYRHDEYGRLVGSDTAWSNFPIS